MSAADELQQLQAALRDGSAAERREAAFKLSAMKNPLLLPDLLAAAGDDDQGVRSFITSALVYAGPGAAKDILALTQSENPHARETGARVLGMLGDVSAVEALRSLLKDRDAAVRAAAAAALVKLDAG